MCVQNKRMMTLIKFKNQVNVCRKIYVSFFLLASKCLLFLLCVYASISNTFISYLPFRKLLLIVEVKKKKIQTAASKHLHLIKQQNTKKCNGQKSYNGICSDLCFISLPIFFRISKYLNKANNNSEKHRTVNKEKQSNKSNVLLFYVTKFQINDIKGHLSRR